MSPSLLSTNSRSLARLAFILFGAVAVNLALFLVMERLATHVGSAPILRIISNVDFLRLKREIAPPEVQEKVEPPEEQAPEDIPDVPALSSQRVVVNELSAPTPRLKIPLDISGGPYIGPMGMGEGIGEFREPVPLVRTPPLYPPQAQARRIEGKVRVEFTVGEDGSVNAPVVVYSEPDGVFDRAVLSAIRNWKFETKVVNGQAVPWRTSQTVAFRMEN